MYARNPQVLEHRADARMTVAAVALLLAVLAGCASELTPRPDATPYVGVFTGEFVDGKPLYRLPTIEVVGLRSRTAPGT